MFITVELLKSKGACEGQVELFEEKFPNGVEATEEVCVSVAHRFDFNWAATRLFSDDQLHLYGLEHCLAAKECGKARLANFEVYRTKISALNSSYPSAEAHNTKEYQDALSEILAQDGRNLEHIQGVYDLLLARLFGRISST